MANANGVEAVTDKAVGAANKLGGRVSHDATLELEGAADEAKGAVKAAAAKAQDATARMRAAVHDIADHATAAIATVGDRAKGLYSGAADRVRSVGDNVTPFVRERPYAGLAIAATAGFLIGALIAGAGSRVVYVRRRG